MSQFTKIKSLPQSLVPLYLTEESFWNRFFKISRIEDPFARVYDICDDIFHNNVKVAVKDYGSNSPQQCQNVIDNLNFYRSIQKLEELCKLVAFCQEELTGDIKAAFQYRDVSLEDVLNSREFQNSPQEFYTLILRELFESIKNFKIFGIQLEDFVLSNILLYRKNEDFKLKILYDEREKKYDKVQEGLKTYCSPQKINKEIKQSGEDQNELSEQIIFQLGLLLLDVIYLYESTAERNAESSAGEPKKPTHLSKSTLFKGYLTFESYTSCSLNNALIQAKIEYLSSLNSNFLTQFLILVKKMLANVRERLTMTELESSLYSFSKKYSKKIVIIQSELKQSAKMEEISPIKSRESSLKIEDSLKYSDSRQEVKKTIPSQTTVPASKGILQTKQEYEHQHENNNEKHEFCIIPKEKLLESTAHHKIKEKLQMFVIELQNKVSLNKKNYYDGNTYYGEINLQKHTREGLGIYIYHYGDIYFGMWKENSLLSGTYIFKNGDCFEGTVKNGKQGSGTYYYFNGNIYHGGWVDDFKQGEGKMFYANGDSYDGTWVKGKKNGFGTYFFNNGTIYRGNFANGKKNGFGTIDFNDGTKVEANWMGNHIEGKGKIFYQNGDYFQGLFNFSLKQGEGYYSWADQIKYEGFFKKDLMEGFAKITYANNQYYEGHIYEGRKQGQGYYKYKNGQYFKGEWKNDEKVLGEYHYQDGGVFEGKFSKGEMSYGVMIYPNGQNYEGQFLNGQRHGLGVYRNTAGNIMFEGQWSHENFIKAL